MKKKRLKRVLNCLLIILVLLAFFSVKNLKSSYAVSNIVYNDDGTISLYADDLSELDEEGFSKVRSVTFRTEMPDSSTIDLLKKAINIEEITLTEVDVDDITFINEITSSSNITLYFIKTTVDFTNINNNSIRALNVADSVIKHAEAIESLTSLEQIGFSECDGCEELDFSKFPNLTELTFACYIEDIEEFIDSIPNVTSLSLSGTNIQNKDTVYLKELSNLTYLNLNQTYLTDIDFVTDLPNLETLVLPWSITDLSPVYELNNLHGLYWEAYTELFVTQELVNYLDENNIDHYDYDPNIKNKINDILSSLEIDENTDTIDSLEKIVTYIIENTPEYDSSAIIGNPSSLDILIDQHMGVCYHHSIAVYTLAKVLSIDDIYAVSGILMRLTDIHTGNEYNDVIDHNFYEPHGWDVINIDGVWYGVDAAQMNEGTSVLNETLFNANFMKNPFEDDDYDYNYSQENFYDFNYFFSARHDETDGTLRQTQTFQFDSVDNLNIINHVIYNFDVTDSSATNLCSRVLDNYDCTYYDTDNNAAISSGDKVVITKNNVMVDSFVINTGSYVQPVKTHLGRLEMEYANYPSVEIVNQQLNTQYFNENNSLKIKIEGDNYNEALIYETKIEVIDYANNEIVYTNTSTTNGKNINDGLQFLVSSSNLTAKNACDQFWCEPDYIINVYVAGEKREIYIWYRIAEKNKFNITIDSDNNVSITSTDLIDIEKNSDKDFEISAKLGYRIVSIKVNGVERISDYKDNKITIENITEDINIVVETMPEEYSFVAGNNSVYLDKDMVFKINGPLEIFAGLYINGKLVDPKYYILENGSTIITLSNNYLKTLSSGEYTMVATYSNGTSASATFTINNGDTNKLVDNGSNNDSNPNTYDGIVWHIIIMILSIGGIIVILRTRKKEEIEII